MRTRARRCALRCGAHVGGKCCVVHVTGEIEAAKLA